MSEYYCPHCGADLEEQLGFDPDAGYWTCTECGQFLTDPDDDDSSSQYEGVGWFCDECGAYLNKQIGFSDWYSTWTCTECGHTNNISEDEIYDSEEEYQASRTASNVVDSIFGLINAGINAYATAKGVSLNDDDEDDDDEDDDDEDDDEYDSDSDDDDDDNNYEDDYYNSEEYKERIRQEAQRRAEQELREAEEARIRQEERKEKRRRFWGTITRKKTQVGISMVNCRRMQCDQVMEMLKNQGFFNITTSMVEDLTMDRIGEEGQVEGVSINGDRDFDSVSQYPINAKIEIIYHKLQRIVPPMTSREAHKKNVNDIVEIFRKNGFENVSNSEIADLTMGWLTKDGSVESVLIDGRSDYKRREKIRLDANIVVTYHTFKKK